jgi:hypothetical protein
MQRMEGGHAVAAALKAEGIDHVFGIVGTHDTRLFDGCSRSREGSAREGGVRRGFLLLMRRNLG